MIDNFNIIESDYTKEFYTLYNKIKVDLDNGLKVKDIKKKYGLTDGSWRKYQKELVSDGIRSPRARSQKEAKFYTVRNGKFIVQKWRKDRKKHIGTFKCKNDAEKCVKLMKENNWDLNQKNRVVEKVKKESVYDYKKN